MKPSNNRVAVSWILLATLILMPVSAAIIHATHGKAISHTWLHLHVLFAAAFTVAGICHVVYNRRSLKNYMFGKK
jgi:hypothetical protein